jgi:hypothetical protein
MSRIVSGLALAALIAALISLASPASAEFFGCNDRHAARTASYNRAPSYSRASSYTHEFAAQQARPRVTIYPRKLSPNAKRHCRAWLAKEYRVSGTVIVPRQQCWWE